MSTKRKIEVNVPAEESDQLLIRPLWVIRIIVIIIIIIFMTYDVTHSIFYANEGVLVKRLADHASFWSSKAGKLW